jgi:hypothetical protein
MTGEMTSPSTEPGRIRVFGLVAFLFFGCLSALGFWRERQALGLFFGALSAAGLGLLLLPEPLSPLYRAWLRTARVIGAGVTAVVLAVAYYLVITPSGLIKRIFGGRPLPVRPDRSASTYWVPRSEPAQGRERFTKRF